jgi:hypothetical protein
MYPYYGTVGAEKYRMTYLILIIYIKNVILDGYSIVINKISILRQLIRLLKQHTCNLQSPKRGKTEQKHYSFTISVYSMSPYKFRTLTYADFITFISKYRHNITRGSSYSEPVRSQFTLPQSFYLNYILSRSFDLVF